MRRSSLPYVTAFQEICQGGLERVHEARSMVLLRTNGQCPARNLVDAQQGTCLPLDQVCVNSTKIVETSKDWAWQVRTDLVADGEKMAKAEAEAKPRWRCALSRAQLSNVMKLARDHSDSVVDFRKEVLRKVPDARGIHFFTWDGKPRSIPQIEWALCHYSTNAQKIERVFWILVSLAGLVHITKAAWSFGMRNADLLQALWYANTGDTTQENDEHV